MLRDGSHLHTLFFCFLASSSAVLTLGMTKTAVVTVACSLDFSSYLLREGSR